MSILTCDCTVVDRSVIIQCMCLGFNLVDGNLLYGKQYCSMPAFADESTVYYNSSFL